MGAGYKRAIAKNTSYNAAMQSVAMGAYFFLIPFIISKIGVTAFGVYVLARTLVQYFGLLEFGASASLVKFTAEHHARDDRVRLGETISSVFIFYIGLGLIIAGGLVLLGYFWLDAFQIPVRLLGPARRVIYILAVTAALSWPLSTFRNILAGLQRYDTVAKVGTVITLMTVGASVAVLVAGGGLVGLVLVEAVFSVLSLMILVGLAVQSLGFFPVRFSHVKRRSFRALGSFSLLVFAINLGRQVTERSDALVLGLFLPVGTITLYEVANKVQALSMRVSEILGSAVMPAASELDSADEDAALRDLFLRGGRYAAAFTLSTTIALFLTVRPLIIAWLGSAFAGATLGAQLFLSLWFVNAMRGLINPVLVGTGHVKVLSVSVLAKSVINLATSVYLVTKVGFIGVIIGTLVSELVVFPVVLGHSLRILDIKLSDFFRHVVLKVYAPLLLTALLAYPVTLRYVPGTLPGVGGQVLAIALGYLVVFYWLGMDRAEKREARLVVAGFLDNRVTETIFRRAGKEGAR